VTAGPATRRGILGMSWRDLLFAHWPMPPEALAPLLPEPLVLDTFDGLAWLGIVPFRMTHVRPLQVPLPGEALAFSEVNVRTYARAPDGTAGVWFLSLDGQHRLGAAVARAVFGVPYRYAKASATTTADGWTRFASRRRAPIPAELDVRYRAVGQLRLAEPGSLEAFLTDRPTLFAVRRGRLWRSDVEHAPWPLTGAEATFERNTMTAPLGIVLPDEPPHLMACARLDTIARRPALIRPRDGGLGTPRTAALQTVPRPLAA
jgi:uncharacterized protein YqjF (DUF2071 family)